MNAIAVSNNELTLNTLIGMRYWKYKRTRRWQNCVVKGVHLHILVCTDGDDIPEVKSRSVLLSEKTINVSHRLCENWKFYTSNF